MLSIQTRRTVARDAAVRDWVARGREATRSRIARDAVSRIDTASP
jgi:hypothetical protein